MTLNPVIVGIIIMTNKEPLWHIKQVLSVFVCYRGAMLFSEARAFLEHRTHAHSRTQVHFPMPPFVLSSHPLIDRL